jgi:hypothetical protein
MPSQEPGKIVLDSPNTYKGHVLDTDVSKSEHELKLCPNLRRINIHVPVAFVPDDGINPEMQNILNTYRTIELGHYRHTSACSCSH